MKLAWEPRGVWWKTPDEIRKICDWFELICCVDPFRNGPLITKGVRLGYFRLHGFGKPSMYMYRYPKSELRELLEKCFSLSSYLDSVSVFFNNAYIYENALEFRALISSPVD